jgi:hypothetical protein
LCDKVQQIIDIFKLLSPEHQDTMLERACNILMTQNSTKKPADCTSERKGKIFEGGETEAKE